LKFVIEAAGLTVAGGKELALDLMTHLSARTEHQFTCIVPDLAAYKSISSRNLRTIVCPRESGLVHRARLLNQQVPQICRREQADALLCLGNFVPWKRVCPTTVLLQNAWIVYGDPVAESRRTLREHLITAYGRHAYRNLRPDVTIITQTPVMKDHLCRRFRIPPARVAIIPNALSLAKLRGSPALPVSLRKPGANPFTFLCLAHCYAHKNIDILADAVERLPQYTRKPAKCVITVAARQHPRARRLLERLSQGDLAGKVENIGPVESERLPQVYQNADALIFPTLLESFSRTYLEAQYFGLPILTSDRDFAHHLCGNAALYFDPLDAESVARSMARMMEDSALRRRLAENGRNLLAHAPSWHEIADRFVEVLERSAGAEGSRELAVGSRQKAEGSGQNAVGGRELGVGIGQEAESTRQKAVGSGQFATDGDRFSEGHEQTASAPPQVGPDSANGQLPSANWLPPATDSGLESDHRPLPTAFCLLPIPRSSDVRTLFNQKARRWRSKYGPKGALNSRVEQFASRLAALCPPPAHILDLGCGTGEIAAALEPLGYRVTACDLAEEMIAVARRSHQATAVEWVTLEPGRTALPFANRRFDAVLASSVFEYLDDVGATAAELARVLRPDGVMLLTVPNPRNVVRKLEARLSLVLLHPRLAPALRKVPRVDAYAAYLRLSRNRFEEQGWQSVLRAAHFVAVDQSDFLPDAWQRHAPLVLLAVKRAAEQIDREPALYLEAAR
jgi:glycosyltransferase involved in cell wall biosynthesis/SAM-dependent methyltransferase